MPPSVAKCKSAFQFYQTDRLKDVKKEMGATMGEAMTELSQRWKSMNESGRKPYFEMEARDKQRFFEESHLADIKFAAIQKSRRENLITTENEETSTRAGRSKMNQERMLEAERKRERRNKRAAETDPEELEKRRKIKAAKKAETLERQRIRSEQEAAVAARHKKLSKASSKSQDQRLEYLLKQSSIFAKLKMGGSGSFDEDDNGKEGNNSSSKNSRSVSKHRVGKGKKKVEENQEEEEEEEANLIFLTKQPNCIKFGTLKPYQLEGLNWMIHLAEKGLNGILADEMGLGKTLQSISILAYHFEFLRIQGPHLICVPKSTLSNWMNELARWCPTLRVIRFHGKKEERDYMRETYFTNEAAAHHGKRPKKQKKNMDTGEMEDDNSNNPRKWDVCVTTYEVCNTERKPLQKFAWKYLVIDEAHRLKNETSMFSKTVRTFHTNHRLLLTGTPLQNNLHELWALLNFLLPDIFSDSDQFDEWFNLEIDDEEAKKKMIQQLHKILRPFMLRRLKRDVAKGLPPKTETLLMVGMSKIQKQLYRKLLLRDIDSITGKSTGSNKTAVLNIVMQLRKCCGHPYLFEGVEDRTLNPLGEHLVENCGKLVLVDKLLKKLKERGSRVLIFTQMTRVLDILEDFMLMRKYQYCRIDGNTDYHTRESSIDEYNREGTEKFVFILSTRAGGLGINLQTADTCILYDSDWNPQADLQAQDRCHRLGQKKPVNVYRLVSENTVEEKIVERAQQKLKLDAMVVQQGRLKENHKVTKEDIMNAVRFGADAVFRSEESTITDDDIDVILERGAAKTKEMAEKITKAEKGDLLDFRLDGGMSAQTFEGVDYSDKELRTQLRLLAADSLGKRERRAPPTNYNPVMTPKKMMVVNNRRIKLPKSLRLPKMEEHQFYNRERLLDLSKLEFQTYATLREMGQLPSREKIDKAKTILMDELAQEKIELLEEGFGSWSRSQYFQFVKANAKYGREDLESIATDMDLPVEEVAAYSDAFWKYGATELKADEWERVKANIEKGEQKIVKKKKLSHFLGKFVNSFENPREEMTFSNKGTAHFALEQDRALLSAVNNVGYGNWDEVREELRSDEALLFNHTVQGMNVDMIAKRCDYRIRQMEKELEQREKKLKGGKPPNVLAAERAVKIIKESVSYENRANAQILRGEDPPTTHGMPEEVLQGISDRIAERQPCIDRIREIEIQVRGCKALADETRKAILGGAQYVNYSSITLKAGGPHTMNCKGTDGNPDVAEEVEIEAKLNPRILAVPPCGLCKSCLDKASRTLCVKRKEARDILLSSERLPFIESVECIELNHGNETKNDKSSFSGSKTKPHSAKVKISSGGKKLASYIAPSSRSEKTPRPSIGEKNRGNPLGNKKMAVPEELVPELCSRIGAQGTHERMKVITDFVKDHPVTSIRQVTLKFSLLVTKKIPGCVSEIEKKSAGRVFSFYLRPKFYRLLSAEERPANWAKYADEDEQLFQREAVKKEKENAKKEKKMMMMMEDAASKSILSEDSADTLGQVQTKRPTSGDKENERDVPPKRKKTTKKRNKKQHK